MSFIKEILEDQRYKDINKDMIDSDLRYKEFLEQQYPQHVNSNQQLKTKDHGNQRNK